MRWYWALQWDNSIAYPYCSDKHDLKGFQEIDFGTGALIENWDPTAWIKTTDPECDGTPDDVLQDHLGLPIYSTKLRTVLEIANISGIQYLPLRVIRRSGQGISGYAIANILNLPAAMDLKKSTYSVFGPNDPMPERWGTVSGVHKMVLRQSALSEYDIILPKEFAESAYVSERFKRVFEAAGCTGYGFKEVPLSLD
jgi:uncharacterized protein DUF1629